MEETSLSEHATIFFFLNTTRRVSPYSSDLEMNLTSSFLLQSDELAIGPHLLVAPACTVVKPAEHEFAHLLSPTQEGASGKTKLFSVCGRITAWHEKPRVLQDPCFDKMLVFTEILVSARCLGSQLVEVGRSANEPRSS